MTPSQPHYLYQELLEHFAKDPTFFEFIQKSSLDGLWYWDLEHPEHEWMSPEFWTTLGYNPSEKEHSPQEWQDLIHPEDQQIALHQFKAHCENPDIPYDQNVRYRHADGSTVWIRCRGLALRDPSGKPIRMLGAHTNITELKEAELELNQKETLWRTAMEGSGIGVWSWSLENDHVFYSDEWMRMLQCDQVENTLTDFLARIHPEDVSSCKESLQKLQQGQLSTCVKQHRMQCGNGAYLWVQTHAKVAQVNGAGIVQQIVGTQIDISQAKATELNQQELLKTLEERTLLLSTNNEMTRTGWWAVDLATEQVIWSDITRDIHEVDADFIPRLETGISFYKEGDSRDRIQKDVDEALSKGSTFKGEYQLITAKGREIWVQSLGKAEYNEQGDVVRILGCFQDITERKEQQLALQKMLQELRRKTLLLESSGRLTQTGWWSYDLITGQVDWSDMIREIYELEPTFTPTQDTLGQFYKAPETQEALRKAFDLAIREHQNVDEIYEVISAKGKHKWVHLTGQVEFEEQQPVRLFGALQDITASKEAEHILREAKKKAEAASEAKDHFLANMSHEMRTPLNGIVGFTELMLRTPLNPLQQSYLQAASYSARSLTTVINSVLDFSKLEKGEVMLQEERVLLSAWIQHLTDSSLVRMHQKDLEFLLNISSELPDYIWIDPLRLAQVVEQLLDNAIKFTEKGEVELSIRALQHENQSYLRIAIRDTGIGIESRDQHLIFDSFSQADISSTRKFGGLGLGLNLVQRLLKLMHSELCVESSPGEGSLFWFNLPIQSESNTAESEPLQLSPHFKRILVIDDNPNNRRILEDMLKLDNLAVDSVPNGFSGLQKLLDTTYDFAIIDYHMPIMDGIEVIQKIRQEMQITASALPILLLHSSTEQARIKNACQQLHINFEEMKPITLERLRHILHQVQTPDSHHGVLPQQSHTPVQTPILQKALNILVVDDNEVNLILAENLVKEVFPEARVHTALNGEEAILAHQRLMPDMILMDIQMPVKNGYDATVAIRQHDTEVPIIAITAGTQTGERERCLSLGMNDYLSKPVIFEHFRHTLLKHMSNRDLQKLPHINYTLLQERVQKLNLDLEHIKAEILQNLEDQLHQSHEALRQKDMDRLHTAAKRMRGSALYLCFERMAGLAEGLEHLKSEQLHTAQPLLASLSSELNWLKSTPLALSLKRTP